MLRIPTAAGPAHRQALQPPQLHCRRRPATAGVWPLPELRGSSTWGRAAQPPGLASGCSVRPVSEQSNGSSLIASTSSAGVTGPCPKATLAGVPSGLACLQGCCSCLQGQSGRQATAGACWCLPAFQPPPLPLQPRRRLSAFSVLLADGAHPQTAAARPAAHNYHGCGGGGGAVCRHPDGRAAVSRST